MSEAQTPEKHCKHFVLRKKRYCRIPPKPDDDYCAEHQQISSETETQTEDDSKAIRIVCPLDRKQ